MLSRPTKITYLITAIISLLLFVAGLMEIRVSNVYLGLAMIFLSLVLVFYALCIILRCKFPKVIHTACRITSVTILIGVVYFCSIECLIINDAWTMSLPNVDYIIVLGSGVYGSEPSPTLVDRLECTFDYLIEHPDCIAILTGGNETGQEITEAECMFQWLTARGIEETRLIRESSATSTEENFAFSIQILKDLCDLDSTEVGVVSSDYHIHRAKYLAAHQGLPVVGIPARSHVSSTALNNYIREAFGMTYYYVFGVENV